MKLLTSLNILLFAILLTSTSCEEVTIDQTFPIGSESNFRMNQLYTSADGQYTIKITEISDSRCPEGVQCGWQGEVNLKGEWTVNAKKTTFELHSVLINQTIQPEGYTIQIVDAKPYPKHGVESKPENLIITLKIEKK